MKPRVIIIQIDDKCFCFFTPPGTMISTGLNCGKKLARAQQEYFVFLQFQSNKKQVRYKKNFIANIINNSYDLKVWTMRLRIITQSRSVHFWSNFSNCAKKIMHTGKNCSRRFFTGTIRADTFLNPNWFCHLNATYTE